MTDRAAFRRLPDAPDVAPVANSPTEVLSGLSVTAVPHDWTRLVEATGRKRSGGPRVGDKRTSPRDRAAAVGYWWYAMFSANYASL